MMKNQNELANNKNENKQDKKTKTEADYFISLIGFVLGVFDQVSDVLVILTNQFATYQLYIAAVSILVINVFIINFFCLYKIIQCQYWKPNIKQNYEMKKNDMIAYIMRLVNIFILVLNYILNFIFCQVLSFFIIWFGLCKLIKLDDSIKDFMQEVFLKENKKEPYLKNNEENAKLVPVQETQPLNKTKKEENQTQQNQENQTQQNQEIQTKQNQENQKNAPISKLYQFLLKIELIEKVCENIPQLILQIVNQAYGGSQNQVLNNLSITFAILRIIFDLFLALKSQNLEVHEWCQQLKKQILNKISSIAQKLNEYFISEQFRKNRVIILAISCLFQVSIYILVTISYQWNDFIDGKSQSYGKDAADSIRTFIILFPIGLIFCFILKYIYNQITQRESYKYAFIGLWLLKDIVFFQFFVDSLAFHPKNMNYGQNYIGHSVFIFLSVLGFLSIIVNNVEIYLYDKPLQWKENIAIDKLKILKLQVYLYIIVKSFQQFVNFANYYSWQDRTCNGSFNSLIKAYLILYFYKVLLPIFQNKFNYHANDKQYKIYQIICYILFLSPIMFIIIDSFLLYTTYKEIPCGDLIHVQKHFYNLILEIGFDLILLTYLNYQFYKNNIKQNKTNIKVELPIKQ